MVEPPASDGLALVPQPLTGQTFRVTSTGLVVTGDPSFEEWEHVGERLAALERGLQWAIGDWLNYGSRKYARGRYETVAASLSLEKETVRKYAQVAAAYESGIRIPDLTFLHHQIAAALPAQQRQALLLEAGRRGWSASRLKRTIRDLSTVAPAAFPAGKYRVIYADPRPGATATAASTSRPILTTRHSPWTRFATSNRRGGASGTSVAGSRCGASTSPSRPLSVAHSSMVSSSRPILRSDMAHWLSSEPEN